MNLTSPFSILSIKEKRIHSIFWIIGLIAINIPNWRVTLGPFHSDDFSLLIPSVYGMFLNAYLFYSSAMKVRDHVQANLVDALKLSCIVLVKLSIVEAIIDTLFYALFYWTLTAELTMEIIWGQLLMNAIFFYFPSLLFGFIKAWQKDESDNTPTKIKVKSGSEILHLLTDDLSHIESDGNYCIYHTNKKILARQSLSQVEVFLPKHFVRCHKSYVVNTHLITKQTYKEIHLGEIKIPIGRKYRDQLKAISNNLY